MTYLEIWIKKLDITPSEYESFMKIDDRNKRKDAYTK